MDVVWPFAIGLFAAFLLFAGAAAMISGRVVRVMRGSTHREWAWRLSGLRCRFVGFVAIVVVMASIAVPREVRVAQSGDFFRMLMNGSFAVTISGDDVFLLGINLLMADRLGKSLVSVHVAERQRGP